MQAPIYEQNYSQNIPILPMASLTFAEAKVVAPPIMPREHPANTAQSIKGPS